MKFPYNYYLVNKRYGTVYCAIPKNASGYLRRWFLLLSGYSKNKIPKSNIGVCLRKFRLKNPQDLKLFKFVFVRNPWSRLVSAFLNKFSIANNHPNTMAAPVIRQIQKTNKTDYELITFRQFIEYLHGHNNYSLYDDHWKPQYLFLKKQNFQFVGKIETFNNDFKQLNKKLHLPLISDIDITNSHKYCDDNKELYADVPIGTIVEEKRIPNYKYFFDNDMRDIVRQIYYQDISKFGYSFEL